MALVVKDFEERHEYHETEQEMNELIIIVPLQAKPLGKPVEIAHFLIGKMGAEQMQDDEDGQYQKGHVAEVIFMIEPQHNRKNGGNQQVFHCPYPWMDRVDSQSKPE